MEGPEDTLPTPFDLLTDDFLSARHNASQPTRSLIELAMIGLSATLREKPEWWHKYKLADVRARWRNEALEQGLSEAQTDYVLDELAHYDSLRVEATGIEVSCCDGIWQSDQLIAPNIGQALRDCVKVLEDVSEGLKDWHPRSNGLVLDLVHPSLYPLVYGRTLVRSTQPRHEFVREALELTHRHAWGEFVDASRRRPWRSSVQLPLDDDPNEWTVEDIKYWLTQIPESEVGDPTWLRKAEVAIGNRGRELLAILANWRLAPAYSTGFENSSERFAWLPTDFDIDAAGRATALAYINNLHPANSTLTKTVEEVLSAFVPLFERVLSDLRQPHPLRVRCFARRDHRSRSPGTEPGETDEA